MITSTRGFRVVKNGGKKTSKYLRCCALSIAGESFLPSVEVFSYSTRQHRMTQLLVFHSIFGASDQKFEKTSSRF